MGPDALPRYHRMPQPDRYYSYLFEDIELDGRRVLDIGAGSGHISEYALRSGVSEVVCLEPEGAGSEAERISLESLRERSSRHDGMTVVEKPFQDYTADAPFDLVVLHNVINHLHEEHCMHLQERTASWEYYADIAESLHDVTATGGSLLVCDAGRSSIWSRTGLPAFGNIEWEKHQDPAVWRDLLEQAGFRCDSLSWTPITRLGTPGELISRNRIFAYLRTLHFKLQFTAE